MSFIIILVILLCVLPKQEAKEIERLENIVAETQEALDNGEYEHALRIADSIDYQLHDTEAEREWDIQRTYWVEKVLDAAAANGTVLEYTPSADVDNANEDSDEEDSSGGILTGFFEGVKEGIQSDSD